MAWLFISPQFGVVICQVTLSTLGLNKYIELNHIWINPKPRILRLFKKTCSRKEQNSKYRYFKKTILATWLPEVIQWTWNLILKGSCLRAVCFTTKHSCHPFCPQDRQTCDILVSAEFWKPWTKLTWILMLNLVFTNCVALGKILEDLQLPLLWNQNNNVYN